MDPLAVIFVVIGLGALGAGVYLFLRAGQLKADLTAQTQALSHERQERERELEALKKETLLSARDEAHVIRQAAEQEAREQRAQVQRLEERQVQREEALERRIEALEAREREITGRERDLQALREELSSLHIRQRTELERIGGMGQEEARHFLLKQL